MMDNSTTGNTSAKPLLVLDLDETLIRSVADEGDRECDFELFVYKVNIRPGVAEFLEKVQQWYELAVWSSASPEYVTAVVCRLFAAPERLKFTWSGRRCTMKFSADEYHWFPVKTLKKITRHGFRLERTLIVDDTPSTAIRNYGNLIRVRPFFGDQSDRELSLLAAYLYSIRDIPNFRALEKRLWRMEAETLPPAP